MRACRMENFKTFNAWSDTYYNNIDTTKDDAQNRTDPRPPAKSESSYDDGRLSFSDHSLEKCLLKCCWHRGRNQVEGSAVCSKCRDFLESRQPFLTRSECNLIGVFLSLQA